MACHPGVDDGHRLTSSSREPPDILQVQAFQLAWVGRSPRRPEVQRHKNAPAALSAAVERRGAGLGSIESSTAGGVTPHAGGAVQNGKAARTPAMQSLTYPRSGPSWQAQSADQPVEATCPTRQRHHCRECEILQHFDRPACNGICRRAHTTTQHAHTEGCADKADPIDLSRSRNHDGRATGSNGRCTADDERDTATRVDVRAGPQHQHKAHHGGQDCAPSAPMPQARNRGPPHPQNRIRARSVLVRLGCAGIFLCPINRTRHRRRQTGRRDG